MGIKDLSKLIADVAPKSIKESEIKHYFGRKVAIDASMSLYQFLIAVRSDGAQLTNADGETTSHLMGTFYRVSKCTGIELILSGTISSSKRRIFPSTLFNTYFGVCTIRACLETIYSCLAIF